VDEQAPASLAPALEERRETALVGRTILRTQVAQFDASAYASGLGRNNNAVEVIGLAVEFKGRADVKAEVWRGLL